MRPLYQACEPRPEVLQGELREELFAARLKDVLDGTADAVYQDPTIFFDNTYPTEGLRTLLREALGRLTGRDSTANAVIRLETPFGGGKTHNLIALYHAACGSESAAVLVNPDLIPSPGTVSIAGIVGSELDPTGGLAHPGVTTYTLWGELAYQLGGATGYQLVAESDRQTKAAPGAGLLDQLVGDQPTLILIDEIARYLRAAGAVPTATGRSDLAEQTVAFLMSLLEFAASRKHVVVVLTLADTTDAFGGESEKLRERLDETRRVTARSERVITPAAEQETASIVAHRLFRTIDRNAARETAKTYLEFYRQLVDQGTPLPYELTTTEYADRIVTTYPFHPELLRVLSLRIATIPNFQRTRGALRLLALVVRRLWEQRPQPLHVIHPHHVDLSQPSIVEDLTSRLDRPIFKQVIEADIAARVPGQPAHAQQIDAEFATPGRPPYAQRLATTIFLNSLVQAQAAGIEEPALLAAVLEPGNDPALLRRALDQLLEHCWYLADDGRRYRFGTEVQLPKLIADEMAVVAVTMAKAKLEERIRQIWQHGVFEPVFFPSEPADIPDDADTPKLVIIHFDAATAMASMPEPPGLVRTLFEQAGVAGSFRRYRNNLVFLVADQDQRDSLVSLAKRYLAIDRLTSDPSRLHSFSAEQLRRLRELRDQTELELRVGITRAYRFLYYPSGDLPYGTVPLAREILPAQDQGAVKGNQTEVIARRLHQLNKLRLGDDSPLPAAFVRARAWDGQQGKIATEDLRRAFAQRVSLPMLADLNLLKRTIREGVRSGEWVYYSTSEGKAYDTNSPEPLVEISEGTFLYAPEEAARLNLPRASRQELVETRERCPVCGNPVEACTCGEENGERVTLPTVDLSAAGPPAQAFQDIADRCRDAKISRLARIRLKLEGDGQAAEQELRALGVVLGQLERGRARVWLKATAEFGEGELLDLRFQGEEGRSRPVRQLLEGLAGQASKFTALAQAELDFGPEGLAVEDELGQLGEVFANLPFGRVELEAEPAETQREAAL
ncbi:MAG: ATP-binding protein [Thermorudis peleae]|nr:ATP-binding protein [Thermorudis peleae]